MRHFSLIAVPIRLAKIRESAPDHAPESFDVVLAIAPALSERVPFGRASGKPNATGSGTPAATLSTMTDTKTRVPRTHARPWQTAGFTLIRSRQFCIGSF